MESMQDEALYPWAPPYLELLCTHVNIDHHPVLHAQASVFSRFVNIMNSFLEKAFDEPDQALRNNYQLALRQCSETIQYVIHHWSHLTEQLNKTDDLVFNGLGSVPALYETIPTSILIFYHAFIHEIISVLSFADQDRKNWNYDYDFLLVPEQSQRPRISRMFDLYELHNYLIANTPLDCKCNQCIEDEKDCVCYQNCLLRDKWPEKQVYLVEFQKRLLYHPMEFLFLILHECLHFFGDSLRQRVFRADALRNIIVNEILYIMDMDKPWFAGFRDALREELTIDRAVGLNLLRTSEQFHSKLLGFFTCKKMNEIIQRYQLQDAYYLAGADTLSRWLKLNPEAFLRFKPATDFWGNILWKWQYYFRECYADLMSLLFFPFTLEEYFLYTVENEQTSLAAIEEDGERQGKISQFSRRLALVLAAYGFEKKEYTKQDVECSHVIMILKKWTTPGFIYQYKDRICQTILALLCPEEPDVNELGQEHINSLKYVLDYLYKVKNTFLLHKANGKLKELDQLTRDFVTIFREGNLFHKRYYEIIDTYDGNSFDREVLPQQKAASCSPSIPSEAV